MLEQQIGEEFKNKTTSVEARKNSLGFQRKNSAWCSLLYEKIQAKKTKQNKNSVKNIEQKAKDEGKDSRTKTMLESDQSMPFSIKCLAIKKINEVKLTTRFSTGKVLMFAKLSHISFIYDLLKTFCFRSEKTRKIHEK